MAQRNRLTTAGWRVRQRLASDDRLVASVRRDDPSAFEAIYERHAPELLAFCVYMLSSRHDAEDAVQLTFAAAYRALRADLRQINLRPWLLTIARNNCLSILRARRPTVELNGEPALRGDPFRELELRDEIVQMLESVCELPEGQRAALVLAELHGLSQTEIGEVLGIHTEKVKAFVYQARSNLISDRKARDTDCREIREELATARGAALLRGRLRRHIRSCADCRTYADGVASQRRQLGVLLPLAPSLVLRYRALEDMLGIGGTDPATYAGGAAVGGSVAGAAVEVAGGGVKALAVKLAASVAVLGAGAGVGASMIGTPVAPERRTASIAARSAQPVAAAFGRQTGAVGLTRTSTAAGGVGPANAQRAGIGRLGGHAPASATKPRLRGVGNRRGVDPGISGSGNAISEHGSSSGQGRTHQTADHPPHGGGQPGGEGRQSKARERAPKTEQREHHGQEKPPKGEEERLQAQREHQQRQLERERRKELRASKPPPKTEEQRQQAREERERQRAERE